MNSHSIKMIGGLAIMFVIAGLQALHAVPVLAAYSNLIDMIVPILLVVEHQLEGNTEVQK